MAIPIPTRKPDISGGGRTENFIDFLFDTGKNAISEVSTLYIQEYQAEKLADIRALEESARTQNQQVLAGYQQPLLIQGNTQPIVGVTSILAIGLLVTAGVLLFRG